MLKWLGGTAFIIATFSSSVALSATFPCTDPIKQVDYDVKGDIDAEARTFLKIGSAEAKGRAERSVVDLYSKYPNADRVAIISNLLSTSCYLIRDSNLEDKEKIDRWTAIFPTVQMMLDKSQADTRSSSQTEATVTANYLVCIGEHGDRCPPNSVHLGCGDTVARWAKAECSSFGETKLDDVGGNKCGYYTAQVTCQKVLRR